MPDQIQGFWSFDKMHAPRPITPLSSELIIPGLSWGFTTAQAEYDSPVVVDHKMVNYYYYARFYAHEDEAVVADRVSRYETTLWQKVPTVGPRWETEWKPALIELVERNKRADWSALSDAELLDQLQWFMDHMGHQWYVHGHINFALLAASSFCDFYDEVMQPTDTTESYQCLQGYRTRSVDATQGLWNLGRSVRNSPELTALWDKTDPKTLVDELGKSDSGKAFLAQLDAFLFEFGWRSDAVYDMADITWREDPSIPLAALTGYIALPDSEDPETHFVRSAKRREELLAAIRAKLATDPEKLKQLETYFEAAKYNLPLTEDHAFWIDQSGIAAVRHRGRQATRVEGIARRGRRRSLPVRRRTPRWREGSHRLQGSCGGTSQRDGSVGEGIAAARAGHPAPSTTRSVHGRNCCAVVGHQAARREPRPQAHSWRCGFRWRRHG